MIQKRFLITIEEDVGTKHADFRVEQSPNLTAIETLGLLLYALVGEVIQSGLLVDLLRQVHTGLQPQDKEDFV